MCVSLGHTSLCDPWVRKIPWRGNWQPTPGFYLGNPRDRRLQRDGPDRAMKQQQQLVPVVQTSGADFPKIFLIQESVPCNGKLFFCHQFLFPCVHFACINIKMSLWPQKCTHCWWKKVDKTSVGWHGELAGSFFFFFATGDSNLIVQKWCNIESW